MKTDYFLVRARRAFLIHIFALLVLHSAWAQDPSLGDFGYQHMSSKFGPTPRQVPLGNRYCLVVLLDDANTGVFTKTISFYLSAIFDRTATNSVNGFMSENSCGRFQLLPATLGGGTGIMGPLTPNADERNQLATNPGSDTDGQVALSAAVRNGFPIANYDLDHDGTATMDELVLLVVANGTNRGAGQTATIGGSLGGQDYHISVSSVPEYTVTGSFSTVIHELHHNVGNMYDLYYYTVYQGNAYTLNTRRTIASDSGWVHLDPWHKMTMGWNEPRIVSMNAGGLFFIPAPQNTDPTAPVLLYDPSRGAGEYFLLEYRTALRAAGAGYDFQLGTNGLFLWHIQQDDNHDLTRPTSPFGFTGPNTQPFADWIEGPPNNTTPDTPWLAGQTTPYLRWNDGSQAPVRIRTSHFQPTDSGIFVEVLVDRPDLAAWVDFSATSSSQLGSFDFPYHTLLPAVNSVGYAGNVTIKSGVGSPAPITIRQPMTIKPYGGPVTLK